MFIMPTGKFSVGEASTSTQQVGSTGVSDASSSVAKNQASTSQINGSSSLQTAATQPASSPPNAPTTKDVIPDIGNVALANQAPIPTQANVPPGVEEPKEIKNAAQPAIPHAVEVPKEIKIAGQPAGANIPPGVRIPKEIKTATPPAAVNIPPGVEVPKEVKAASQQPVAANVLQDVKNAAGPSAPAQSTAAQAGIPAGLEVPKEIKEASKQSSAQASPAIVNDIGNVALGPQAPNVAGIPSATSTSGPANVQGANAKEPSAQREASKTVVLSNGEAVQVKEDLGRQAGEVNELKAKKVVQQCCGVRDEVIDIPYTIPIPIITVHHEKTKCDTSTVLSTITTTSVSPSTISVTVTTVSSLTVTSVSSTMSTVTQTVQATSTIAAAAPPVAQAAPVVPQMSAEQLAIQPTQQPQPQVANDLTPGMQKLMSAGIIPPDQPLKTQEAAQPAVPSQQLIPMQPYQLQPTLTTAAPVIPLESNPQNQQIPVNPMVSTAAPLQPLIPPAGQAQVMAQPSTTTVHFCAPTPTGPAVTLSGTRVLIVTETTTPLSVIPITTSTSASKTVTVLLASGQTAPADWTFKGVY